MIFFSPFSLFREKINSSLNMGVSGIPNILIAVLLLLLFYILAKLLSRLVKKLVIKFDENQTITRLISITVFYSVNLLGLFFALDVLGLEKALSSLLAGAGIIGLAISLAFQDIVINFISGIIIAVRKPFFIGDFIQTHDFQGKIHKINIRTTEILTYSGQFIMIPNKDVLQKPIINFSKNGLRRMEISFNIPFVLDLEKVKAVSLHAVSDSELIEKEKPVLFVCDSIYENSVNCIIRFWVKFTSATDNTDEKSNAILRLQKAFVEHGIEPFNKNKIS